MDAILQAVLSAAPQLGTASGLVIVLVLLVRREVQSSERHLAELARQAKAHDDETAELLAENTRLRAARDAAEVAIDTERRLRRQAEEQGPGRHRWDPPA